VGPISEATKQDDAFNLIPNVENSGKQEKKGNNLILKLRPETRHTLCVPMDGMEY
jgi:hypothetical protein